MAADFTNVYSIKGNLLYFFMHLAGWGEQQKSTDLNPPQEYFVVWLEKMKKKSGDSVLLEYLL